MKQHSSLPTFPNELVKVIFDLAINPEPATSTDNILLSFIRVSKAWQIWVEPILYRYVILRNEYQLERFLSTLETRSASLSSHVQHLTLAINCPKPHKPTSAAVGGVLAACYALESLTVHPSVLPYTVGLPCDVTLSCLPQTFPQYAFDSVKHLRLQVTPFLLSTIAELLSMNSLTHIAIDFPRDRSHSQFHLLAFLNMVRNLLRSRSVEVVAILVPCLGIRMAFDVILSGFLDERLIAVELSGKDAIDVKAGRSSVWEVVEKAIHNA